MPRGGKAWDAAKGEPNRRAFKRLVESGQAHGVLAFEAGQALGWCCVGPRADFPRTERTRALKSDWDEGTWAVTCFYVPAKQRGRGVATKLLEAAVALARKRGARTLEGYPVRATKPTRAASIPAAFAWTGVTPMFAQAGFERACAVESARELWKLELGARKRRVRAQP